MLPIGISLSDYLDFLIDPQYATAAGQEIVAHVQRAQARWDIWDLEELPPGALAFTIPRPDGCSEDDAVQSACPVLTLDNTGDPRNCIPKRKLVAIRHAYSRGERSGGIAIQRGDTTTVSEMLEDLFRLHSARWQRLGGPGVFASETVQNFHRSAAPLLMTAGILRLYAIWIGGKVAASYYGLVGRDCAYHYITGFDPDNASASPGAIAISQAIDEAMSLHLKEFHFLRGQERYKYEWGAVDRWNHRRSFRRRGGTPDGSLMAPAGAAC